MGVCAQQHRDVTGKYGSFLFKCDKNKRLNYKEFLSLKSILLSTLSVAGLILYVYIICLVMALCMELSLKQNNSLHFIKTTFKQHHKFSHTASETYSTVINNCLLILILHLLKTTKNANPLKQVKIVFCINMKKGSK